MSRNKRNNSNATNTDAGVIHLNGKDKVQVIKAMQNSIAEKMSKQMYHTATIAMYLSTYLANEMEILKDTLDGDNCPFSQRLRNKTAAVVRETNAFIDFFEPLIAPECRKEWNDSFGSFQQGMDNYFRREYRYEFEGERGREICFAASLRYHDPYETNTQRIFQDVFQKGAAYADQHPVGTLTVKRNGKEETFQLKEVVDTFIKAKFGDSIEVSCVMKRTE